MIKQQSNKPLNLPRYLPLIYALCCAYPSMAWADNECGNSGGATQLECTDSTYDSGIKYDSSSDLTLKVGPDVTIGPTTDKAGIAIMGANGSTANFTIVANGTTITSSATASTQTGDGILIDHGGSGDLSIVANNVTIETSHSATGHSNALSNGITAYLKDWNSVGNISIATTGGSITTTGDLSYGMYGIHEGSGNITITSSSDITTSGKLGFGIAAFISDPDSTSTLAVTQAGGTISTSGVDAQGISVTHMGSGLVTVDGAAGSAITTQGVEAHGIAARSAKGDVNMQLSGITISTRGDDAAGVRVAPIELTTPTSVTITSGTITTQGAAAHGIVAGIDALKANDGAFKTVNVTTMGAIKTPGMGSIGVVAVSTDDTLVSAQSNVTATGQFGTGIMATSTAGATNVNIRKGISITGGWQDSLAATSGTNFNAPAAGIVLGGATAKLTNHGNISAWSDRAITTSGVFNAAASDITLDNHGTITGYLSMAGAGNKTTFNNYSPNSFVMRHFADTNGDGIRDTKAVAISDFGGPGSVFNNEALGMVRFGEVTTNTATDATSQYRPTTGTDSRPLAASFYSIVRPGVVQSQLVNLSTFDNAGTIDLSGPTVGNVLAITGLPDMTTPVTGSPLRGVFVSESGKLITSVAPNDGLAGASPANPYADLLVVDSTKLGAGATQILVKNRGGLGGLTAGNGIELIEVRDKTPGASASDAFVLGAPVAAGAYSYQLQHHGLDGDTADGNWYLRSSIADPDSSQNRLKTYRPQVPVYMAAPALASRMGLDMLSTYHDRLGEDYSHTTPSVNAYPKAGWGRIYGGNLKTKLGGSAADRLDQFERYGPAYTMDTLGFQVGSDLYRRPNENSNDVAGAYLGYSHGKAKVQNVLDDSNAGTVKMDAYSLGGYWTRKGDSGWYIDGVLQATLYGSVKAESQGQRLNTRGWGLAASVEGGYPIDIGASWKLEPQAQLIYQHINLKNANDDFGQVRYSKQNAVHARIGARLDKTFITSGGQQVTPWIRTNLWVSPKHHATTTFATTTGTHSTALTTNLGGTWAQFGVGLSGQVKKNVSVFASADYNRNIGGQKSHGVTGRIGLKVAW
ncbi:MAG: autotransporter outer membrane beta-barrel domain-containing protein [Burkholderiaceae bacterium]|nr:autotransporter outer membrane beta-barrel domain-containing protein [Burkholderiaceae bacterium]